MFLGKGTSDGILRPEHLSVLPYQLPITLKLFPTINKEKKEVIINNNEIPKNEGQLQNKSVVSKKKVVRKVFKFILLLLYQLLYLPMILYFFLSDKVVVRGQ